MIKYLLLLLLPCAVIAQDKMFDEITPAHFQEKPLSGETEYDALVLDRLEAIYFSPQFSPQGFQQYKIVKERILIANEAGLDYATERIVHLKRKYDESPIEEIKGTTYNLKDGIITKVELEKSSIFTENLDDRFSATTITMPGVEIGSIIDFTYKLVLEYAYIADIYIQYDIPINNIDLTVSTNRDIVYNVAFNPEGDFKLTFDDAVKERFAKSLGDFDKSRLEAMEEDLLSKEEVILMKNNTISLVTSAIPALIPEPMSGDIDRYRAKLVFEIAAVRKQGTVSSYKYYTTDWGIISKNLSRLSRFGDELGKSGFFRRDLKDFIGETTSEKEKAKKVLEFIKTKIKWNGKYTKLVDEGVKDAYKAGSGNVSEVNLLLTNMFEEVGLETYPVLVSSNDNGIPLFPSRNGFDYVISQVYIDGQAHLADATSKYSYLDILPYRSAHWKGRVIKNKEDSEWVSLEEKKKSQNITIIKAVFNEDNHLDINVNKRTTDHAAFDERVKYGDANQEEIIRYLEQNNAGLELDQCTLTNQEDPSKPLGMQYKGIYKNGVDIIGDKMYLKPLLFDGNDENPFKLESRKRTLKLGFPGLFKTICNITVPEGYEVESLPENTKGVFNDGSGSYTFIVKKQGQLISTVATFELDQYNIEPSSYTAFRDFFIAVVSKDAERIILKKKS